MIISFFDITEDERIKFASLPAEHTFVFHRQSLTIQNAATIKETDILYIRSFSQVTADILSCLPKLKYIATRSTGFDNIDIDYCKQRGIVVSNVPSYATNAVAEHTFGLLLSLTHNIASCVQVSRTGQYLVGPQGFDIFGKTIGIVGLGNIGVRVAEIAKGFGMRVLVNSKHPSSKRAKMHGVKFINLSTLLKESDIVTIHVPLTDETHHMLNMGNISFLKKGSILLNTSRGEIIETQAIHWALQHEILYGAGLDVLENEQGLKEYNSGSKRGPLDITSLNYKFMVDKRVMITPHNAYHTKEALDTILRISCENIMAFLEGNPINRVI